MKKAMIVLVLFVGVTSLFAQSAVKDYDGRNWAMLTREEKVMLILGVFVGNCFVWNMNELAVQENVISMEYYMVFQKLNPLKSVGEVVDAIDLFYGDWGNRPIPLWKAFYYAQDLTLWDESDTIGDQP